MQVYMMHKKFQVHGGSWKKYLVHSTEELSTCKWVWIFGTRKIITWITLNSSQINLHTISISPIPNHWYRSRCSSRHLQCSLLTYLLVYQGVPPRSLKLYTISLFVMVLITRLCCMAGEVPLYMHTMQRLRLIMYFEQGLLNRVLF